jgi:hypothetical protein
MLSLAPKELENWSESFAKDVSSSHFPGHRVCLKLLFRERSGVSRWAHF